MKGGDRRRNDVVEYLNPQPKQSLVFMYTSASVITISPSMAYLGSGWTWAHMDLYKIIYRFKSCSSDFLKVFGAYWQGKWWRYEFKCMCVMVDRCLWWIRMCLWYKNVIRWWRGYEQACGASRLPRIWTCDTVRWFGYCVAPLWFKRKSRRGSSLCTRTTGEPVGPRASPWMWWWTTCDHIAHEVNLGKWLHIYAMQYD